MADSDSPPLVTPWSSFKVVWVWGFIQYIDTVQCIGSVPDRRTDGQTDKCGLFLCIYSSASRV